MYKPSTTAGKGIKWEWLSVTTCEWNVYNMDVQNIIEDAWSKVCIPISIGNIFLSVTNRSYFLHFPGHSTV